MRGQSQFCYPTGALDEPAELCGQSGTSMCRDLTIRIEYDHDRNPIASLRKTMLGFQGTMSLSQ